jgi:hypothetical protein
MPPESFVDATIAAAFLCVSKKYLLRLSRLGFIPAHPFGLGTRKTWRYLLSELHSHVRGFSVAQTASNDYHGTPETHRMKPGSSREGGL